MTSQKGSYEAKSFTFAHEYTYTHNIINMQSITQFSQSATLRVNANKASLNKSSKKVSVQVRAAVSMPSMDSQDEGDDVVASNPEAFVPQAPAAQKGNAVFSETAQLINGRAAMVGFVSAIAGEVITKKEAFELIFPAKMVSGVPTHVIDAQNFSLFAFTIAIATLGTITPKFTQDNFDESREFAIFKTNSEMLNGRAAMIGIVSLLVAENVMGHALF
ncbi:carotene biosynthesis-related protein [Bathycoccus prasinos]|uniref:Carotene biosynthesis-related protein n=1 Tax=Bathycoccus prasinos TaxID=41875 RepID=K8EP53_9CHLO|nr:carotene biosynthesis-related protein [Bathycoccus prasinos]CCO14230.1 carotene biosynthesis-related protein [Bathycoccus prasinos]|eukprot:XP_007515351.1 carotene biosynthesis-related protein [Bathycoccus prasinos]